MDKKVKGAVILVLIVFVVVTVQQGVLYSMDKGIGTGNVQVIAQDSSGHEKWTLGLIPDLHIVTKADALSHGYVIWAAPGDYSGDIVMGITAAIASVMWIVWLGVFLGFPSGVRLKKERILGLVGIALLVAMLNLLFLRTIADSTTSGSVVKNTAAHLSLALNNTGILMAILLHRLGVGVKDPDTPMMPALGSSKCDKLNRGFYKKFYGVLAMLVATGIIEIAFQLSGAAVPEVAVDASVWLIFGMIFMGHFGTFPSDWRLGKRPKGLVMLLVLTVLTVVGFYVLQVATDGSIGSGVLETRLSDAGLNQNAGLSLMLSCWLVFWTIAIGAAGYCDPGVCKAPEKP